MAAVQKTVIKSNPWAKPANPLKSTARTILEQAFADTKEWLKNRNEYQFVRVFDGINSCTYRAVLACNLSARCREASTPTDSWTIEEDRLTNLTELIPIVLLYNNKIAAVISTGYLQPGELFAPGQPGYYIKDFGAKAAHAREVLSGLASLSYICEMNKETLRPFLFQWNVFFYRQPVTTVGQFHQDCVNKTLRYIVPNLEQAEFASEELGGCFRVAYVGVGRSHFMDIKEIC